MTSIILDVDGRGVARLVLNRPEKHNALSGEMCDELRAAAARLDANPGVRVVVLTGAGRSFCAGGDLEWMRAQFQRIQDPKQPGSTLVLKLNLPPSYLLIHRVWVGSIGVLSQLEAELPFRAILEESLPGFAEPA